jgi:hypothetical protein
VLLAQLAQQPMPASRPAKDSRWNRAQVNHEATRRSLDWSRNSASLFSRIFSQSTWPLAWIDWARVSSFSRASNSVEKRTSSPPKEPGDSMLAKFKIARGQLRRVGHPFLTVRTSPSSLELTFRICRSGSSIDSAHNPAGSRSNGWIA